MAHCGFVDTLVASPELLSACAEPSCPTRPPGHGIPHSSRDQATLEDLARSWGVSYLGNVIGCVGFALATAYTGLLTGGTAELAVYTATKKCDATFSGLPLMLGLSLSLSLFLTPASSLNPTLPQPYPTTLYLLLATYCSLLTARHAPLSTCCSLLTARQVRELLRSYSRQGNPLQLARLHGR